MKMNAKNLMFLAVILCASTALMARGGGNQAPVEEKRKVEKVEQVQTPANQQGTTKNTQSTTGNTQSTTGKKVWYKPWTWRS